MARRTLSIVLLLTAVCFSGLDGLVAQGVKAPEKVNTWLRYRPATVADEAGLLQWKAWEAVECSSCSGRSEVECAYCARGDAKDCPECEGDKKAPCRDCQGSAKSFDPLMVMPCPGCSGARVVPCRVCGTVGGMKIEGSGDRLNECKSCDGHRGHSCVICKGKGVLATVKPTKVLAEAEVKHIKAALKAIAEARKLLAITPKKLQLNKLIKAYDKALKPVKKILPAAKPMAKFFKQILKDEEKGGGTFTAWEGNLKEILRGWNARTVWMFDYTEELLGLALTRAEANAAIEAAAKSGK